MRSSESWASLPSRSGSWTVRLSTRVLLDLIRPTSGRARVFGLDTAREAVAIHRRIGYLPGDAIPPGRGWGMRHRDVAP